MLVYKIKVAQSVGVTQRFVPFFNNQGSFFKAGYLYFMTIVSWSSANLYPRKK